MYFKNNLYFLILISIFFWGNIFGQQENEIIEGDISRLHNEIWKFKVGDDTTWANPNYVDNNWESIQTSLVLGEKRLPNFIEIETSENAPTTNTNPVLNHFPDLDGIIWFRWRFVTPISFRDKINGLVMSQSGASQVYFDGKLIKTFGLPSDKKESEEVYSPNDLPFPVYFDDKENHVIAVRYSNLKASINYEKHDLSNAGFDLIITNYDGALNHFISNLKAEAILLIFLGAVFLTLGGIHFVIFLFYRKKRNNLFYSIFMLSASIFCLVTHFAANQNNTLTTMQMFSSFGYIVPIFLMAFLSILYSLFYEKMPKMFWIMLSIMVVIIVLHFTGNSNIRLIIVILFLLTVFVESFRVSLLAIIRRKRGAGIVGAGVLYLLLTIIGLFLMGVVSGGNVDISGSNYGGFILLILLVLALLSVPASMSIYLAWDISSTNKQLSSQLEEVERLSQEAIKQEQEKKVILEKQNEVLESKVVKRTEEITKQKDLLEEKNKEILDSINYAKRIQSAILPPNKVVKEYLKDSLILYKPKDIVAGDFYWLEHITTTTKSSSTILFAAADCTGHGVPGAMVSIVCNNGLNRAVREYGLSDPGEVLDKTREIVIQEFEKSEEEVKDGMDIALCSLEGMTLKYAGAHNPLWIVRNGEVLETKANKQPIGKFDKQVPYSTHIFELQKGDSIFIFSDGYVDQFGGERGKKFKTKAFKKLLLDNQNVSMKQLRVILDSAFESWKGELEQIDDVCVIGVRL